MKLKINKELLKIFGEGLAITVVLSLGARHIEKKLSCGNEEVHAHKYTALGGLSRYVKSEDIFYELMIKSKDEIKYLDPEESKLIDFLDANDLYKINDNIDIIKKSEAKDKLFTEYEREIIKIDNKGKKTTTKKWTNDINNCDGNARDCFYTYSAYKLVEDDGNYKLEESPKVDSVLAIKDEYPYIKYNYEKIVRGEVYQIDIDKEKENKR